jgi:hypothetical protein
VTFCKDRKNGENVKIGVHAGERLKWRNVQQWLGFRKLIFEEIEKNLSLHPNCPVV